MRLPKRLPLSAVVELCRVLRHSLNAGLSLVAIFRQQSSSGPVPARPLALLIQHDLEKGDSLESAVQRRQDAFPPLFLALVSVGEQTGTLTEVCGELERYFQMQLKLRRQFLSQSARPAFQLIVAILIIALLIWVLGLIGRSPGAPAFSLLGVGLTGGRGAVLFLLLAFGSLAGAVALVVGVMRGSKRTDFALFLLRAPLLGPCLQALALARFCLALRLTLDSGMAIDKAADLSLRATGNPAFIAVTETVPGQLRAGRDLTRSLTGTGLLPNDFEQDLKVAEESGQLSETLRRRAEGFHEEAERRLTMLTRAAAFAVWLAMAVVVTWAIFQIFVNVYLAPLGEF